MLLLITHLRNTGHEWTGRSVGAGSLSIWTHYLKSFEYIPQYTQDEYSSRAARVGAGLETWEMFNYMATNNMGVIVPVSAPIVCRGKRRLIQQAGTTTIGPYGGWMAGGGHSILTSSYGMGSDQALSLQIVTADGRFVTADPSTNEDLFFAMRGGGGCTLLLLPTLYYFMLQQKANYLQPLTELSLRLSSRHTRRLQLSDPAFNSHLQMSHCQSSGRESTSSSFGVSL